VLKETKKTLNERINKVLIDLYPIIPELLKISDPNSPEFQATFLKKLNELREKNPSYSNFYNLVYKQTMDFFTKGGEIRRLPNFFSELAMNLSKSLEWKLSRKAPETKIFSAKNEDADEIMEICGVLAKEKIRFKNSIDGEIFYEVVLNSKEVRIFFVSDDGEFMTKANIAKTAVIRIGYDDSKFSFAHISEVENC
jgi:hypothetical protein